MPFFFKMLWRNVEPEVLTIYNLQPHSKALVVHVHCMAYNITTTGFKLKHKPKWRYNLNLCGCYPCLHNGIWLFSLFQYWHHNGSSIMTILEAKRTLSHCLYLKIRVQLFASNKSFSLYIRWSPLAQNQVTIQMNAEEFSFMSNPKR